MGSTLSDMGTLNTGLQGLGTLTSTVGQDWYTAHNVFNPGGSQYGMVQGAGGNTFGTTISQSQLTPSVTSGLFGTTGFGGLSPLLMLIILFFIIIIGYVIIKHI
jgi:hypothetical protein